MRRCDELMGMHPRHLDRSCITGKRADSIVKNMLLHSPRVPASGLRQHHAIVEEAR